MRTVPLLSILSYFLTVAYLSAGLTFTVTYDQPKKPSHFTPRVYVLLTKHANPPVKHINNWFSLPVICAVDDLDRTGKVSINAQSDSNENLAALSGEYNIQAIVRLNSDWPVPGHGTGDLLSAPQRVSIKQGKDLNFDLHADKVVPAPDFRDKGNTQDHYYRSEKLSTFHKRAYNMRYSVILPKNWNPKKKHPVIVYITGFGGVHHKVTGRLKHTIASHCKNAIIVIPDANCRWGHSVFADSQTNGPWGSALVNELLPHIDQQYGGAGPAHRYVTGASSGGWSSLWLTVNYPQAFRACWAVAPDPVDFRRFQAINLRDGKAKNLFATEGGEDRYLSIKRLKLTYRKFGSYEKVLGSGGQLKAFSAVFSKPGKNGLPALWYDENSGAINQTVCDTWEPYDISRLIEKNWPKLKPKLQGKIHVIVHEQDIFLLNFAVKKLEETCKRLGSDIKFSYIKGAGHHMPKSYTKAMTTKITQQWQNRNP